MEFFSARYSSRSPVFAPEQGKDKKKKKKKNPADLCPVNMLTPSSHTRSFHFTDLIS